MFRICGAARNKSLFQLQRYKQHLANGHNSSPIKMTDDDRLCGCDRKRSLPCHTWRCLCVAAL